MPIAAGEQIGKYRILGELGRGGMAVVYRARDEVLKRPVALKVLAEHLTHDRKFLSRFIAEARTAALLDHPNIVHIHEAGQIDGLTYIAMQVVEGRALSQYLEKQGGSMGQEETLQILGQVAEALDYAHSQGVIHRDVKPSNIMVTDDGRVMLMDFGIAKAAGATKLTATGATIGTAEYMSPEQAGGEDVDYRTDIYSLGIVAYEMVAGAVPFAADTSLAIAHKHIEETPSEPSGPDGHEISPGLSRAVLRALAKEPRRRFSSCQAFVDAASGITSTRVPLFPRQRRLRARVCWACTTVLLFALVAIALYQVPLARRPYDVPPGLAAVDRTRATEVRQTLARSRDAVNMHDREMIYNVFAYPRFYDWFEREFEEYEEDGCFEHRYSVRISTVGLHSEDGWIEVEGELKAGGPCDVDTSFVTTLIRSNHEKGWLIASLETEQPLFDFHTN